MTRTSKYYERIIPLINNCTFCRFLAAANTPDGAAAATAYLIDALTYVKAPQRLCDPSSALQLLITWSGHQENVQKLGGDLHTALCVRRTKAKAQINAKQWLVLSIGLDWKSPRQEERRELLLSYMKAHNQVSAHRLPAPYPPPSVWVAESQSIHTKWCSHLSSVELHDDRYNEHLPIHILDWNQLQKNIGPDEDAYICDPDTGKSQHDCLCSFLHLLQVNW